MALGVLPDDGKAPPSAAMREGVPAEARLRAMRDAHFELVWRSLRRLGVPEAEVDDGAQQVFIVAAQRLASIAPGSERAFLFGTALRVAGHVHRAKRRRGEVPDPLPEDRADPTPGADELLDQRRARALLDQVLESLPLEVRAVFVLFELEQMSVPEIAALLDIPGGTAASRLRRGRELFRAAAHRIRARTGGSGA
jgi:RNA polymerase sigma-70 factor (ECF subfamily)